jgi:hypothetical protein
MWRWWEGPDGSEVWWAHIEVSSGEWRDSRQSDYEASGAAPTFWQLPLEDGYLVAVINKGNRI